MGVQREYVSDYIGEDYKNFGTQLVGISAGTGTGKSTFILEHLAPYAKKEKKNILYLCNRTCLKNMIDKEAVKGELSNVEVKTYQSLETEVRNNFYKKEGIYLRKYDYIVVDECHYFMGDSVFNPYTDLSYMYVMGKRGQSTVIMMSATANTLFDFLVEEGHIEKKHFYRIPGNYDYVKNLKFYEKKDLTILIDEVLKNEKEAKIIVFCSSADRMIEMHDKYRNKANYICSETAEKRLLSICDNDCLQEKNGKYTFKKKILFATTALDTGFSLKDFAIKHIFCEIFDADSMIQCFGRKRSLDETDTCTFYVAKHNWHEINVRLKVTKENLDIATKYKKDSAGFIAQNMRDYKKIIVKNPIFDERPNKDFTAYEKYVNITKYFKHQLDIKNMKKMQEIGYMEFVKSLFDEGLASRSEEIGRKSLTTKEKNLLKYLNSLEEKPLYEKEKRQIAERFQKADIKLRNKGISTLNGILDKNFKDFPLRFTNKDESGFELKNNKRQDPNKGKRYWRLTPKMHKNL